MNERDTTKETIIETIDPITGELIDNTQKIEDPKLTGDQVEVENTEPAAENLETTEDLESDPTRREGRVIEDYLENVKEYEKKVLLERIGKTAAGTAASIVGVRGYYDVPAYFAQKFSSYFTKKELANVMSNLEEGREFRVDNKDRNKFNQDGLRVGKVINLDQIQKIQDKIENSRSISEDSKNKLLEELNILVENYNIEKAGLKNRHQTKIKKTLNEYTETKVSGIQAAREGLNSFFTASGGFALRLISSGFMDAVGRYQSEKKRIKKEIKEEKEENKNKKVSIFKDVIIGGIKKTFKEAALRGDGETKWSRSLSAAGAWGRIARYVGISSTVKYNPEGVQNDFESVFEFLKSEDKLGEATGNYKENLSRLWNVYSKLPGKAMDLFSVDTANAGEPEIKMGVVEKASVVASAVGKTLTETDKGKSTDVFSPISTKDVFLPGGEQRLHDILSKMNGSQEGQAFETQLGNIQSKYEAYLNGSLNKDDFFNSLGEVNNAFSNLGNEVLGGDIKVIDIDRIVEVADKNISDASVGESLSKTKGNTGNMVIGDSDKPEIKSGNEDSSAESEAIADTNKQNEAIEGLKSPENPSKVFNDAVKNYMQRNRITNTSQFTDNHLVQFSTELKSLNNEQIQKLLVKDFGLEEVKASKIIKRKMGIDLLVNDIHGKTESMTDKAVDEVKKILDTGKKHASELWNKKDEVIGKITGEKAKLESNLKGLNQMMKSHGNEDSVIGDQSKTKVLEGNSKNKVSEVLSDIKKERVKINIEIGEGDSIWSTSKKYLEARYGEDFSNLGGGDKNIEEALRTHNVDRIKDKITEVVSGTDEALKKRFGLEGIKNAGIVTEDQLKNINFEELDKEVFGSPETESLTENYEAILEGKGDTDDVGKVEVLDSVHKQEPGTAEAFDSDKIIEGFSGLEDDNEARKEFLEKNTDFYKMSASEQREFIEDFNTKVSGLIKASIDAVEGTPEHAAAVEKYNANNSLRHFLHREFNQLHESEIKQYEAYKESLIKLETSYDKEAEAVVDKNIKKIYGGKILGIFPSKYDQEWPTLQNKTVGDSLIHNFADFDNKEIVSMVKKFITEEGYNSEKGSKETIKECLIRMEKTKLLSGDSYTVPYSKY